MRRWDMNNHRDIWWYAMEAVGHIANVLERLGVNVRGGRK